MTNSKQLKNPIISAKLFLWRHHFGTLFLFLDSFTKGPDSTQHNIVTEAPKSRQQTLGARRHCTSYSHNTVLHICRCLCNSFAGGHIFLLCHKSLTLFLVFLSCQWSSHIYCNVPHSPRVWPFLCSRHLTLSDTCNSSETTKLKTERKCWAYRVGRFRYRPTRKAE